MSVVEISSVCYPDSLFASYRWLLYPHKDYLHAPQGASPCPVESIVKTHGELLLHLWRASALPIESVRPTHGRYLFPTRLPYRLQRYDIPKGQLCTLCHIMSHPVFSFFFFVFFSKKLYLCSQNYRHYSGSPRKCDISATSLGV